MATTSSYQAQRSDALSLVSLEYIYICIYYYCYYYYNNIHNVAYELISRKPPIGDGLYMKTLPPSGIAGVPPHSRSSLEFSAMEVGAALAAGWTEEDAARGCDGKHLGDLTSIKERG